MFTQEVLTFFSQHFFLPFVLLINFAYCQYLVTIYFTRRHERRVQLLLACAVLGFLSLLFFSYPNDTLVENLNDMSEVSSVLTFLIQISILGRDVTRRIKVRSLRYMTFVAEVLIVLGAAAVLFNVVDSTVPHRTSDFLESFDDEGQEDRRRSAASRLVLESFDTMVENTGLAFVFVFRFYFLGLSKNGWRLPKKRHRELFLYGLFVTHECPFVVLNHITGLSWEYAQAFYMRLTLVACLWSTLKSKFRLRSSHAPSQGPTIKITPTEQSSRDSRTIGLNLQLPHRLPTVAPLAIKDPKEKM